MPQTEPTTLAAEVIACEVVHELPGDWDAAALQRLLADREVEAEGATGADLLDLVLMALGDLEPHAAGVAVLHAVFGEDMPAGVRANLASDLDGDRPWENFADVSRQAGIFSAVVLLQKAFPRLYGKPDATRAKVAFQAPTAAEAELLASAPAATILRALGPGVGPRSILNRLYGESLLAEEFPEAEHILWRGSLRIDDADPRRVVAEVHGAESFFGTLRDAASWQASVPLPTAD